MRLIGLKSVDGITFRWYLWFLNELFGFVFHTAACVLFDTSDLTLSRRDIVIAGCLDVGHSFVDGHFYRQS